MTMTMMSVAALQKAGETLLSSEKTDVPLLDQVYFLYMASTLSLDRTTFTCDGLSASFSQ